jgi:hypothetical protein
MPAEQSHVLKIKQAHQHLQQLCNEATKWFQAEGNSSHIIEPDPDRPGYFLLKATVGDIPAAPFSLIIGDVVQNLRNGLDHLAYALASTFTKPLPDKLARASQFPIVGDQDRNGKTGCGTRLFKDQSLCIRGVDPKAQAILEGLQPYKLGANFRTHPLWTLQNLSNIDKHRLLHVVTTFSGGFALRPDGCINCAIGPGNLEVRPAYQVGRDTVIASIPLTRIDPNNPEMRVDIMPVYTLAFFDGVSAGQNCIDVLKRLGEYIIAEVIPPLSPFL